jgi:dienelactone hydrolase
MNVHARNDGAALELRRDVRIPAGGKRLAGDLAVPLDPHGLVLFAHGSGSSRFSPRNQAVARTLREAGLGTLLFDLLSENEADDRNNVFDIPLLAHRLRVAAEWARSQPDLEHLPLGLFGASTGAAAALVAAASSPLEVAAVVSRGGRPDLAGGYLRQVRAPTLLIVGGADQAVLDLNRQALFQLTCVKRLAVVPGATHLFEEVGAMAEVARLAGEWFLEYLVPSN